MFSLGYRGKWMGSGEPTLTSFWGAIAHERRWLSECAGILRDRMRALRQVEAERRHGWASAQQNAPCSELRGRWRLLPVVCFDFPELLSATQQRYSQHQDVGSKAVRSGAHGERGIWRSGGQRPLLSLRFGGCALTKPVIPITDAPPPWTCAPA